MSVTFDQSQTRVNLMRAFAGESQARNRYLFAAGMANKQELHVIEAVFRYTADQEFAHAKLFYNNLEKSAGETIAIDGTYPVDIHSDLLQHLRAAQHNEYQEYEHDYAHFSKVADEEGFQEISHIFHQVAQVEQTHGDRFGLFADLMEQGKLFVADTKIQWVCLNCGAVIESAIAPKSCPVCRHSQGYFIRYELAPYNGCVRS